MMNTIETANHAERVVSVAVAESNPLLRLGFRTAIATAAGVCWVGEAGTAAALGELIASTKPDVLLIDARLLAAAHDESPSRRTPDGFAGGALPAGERVDDLIAFAPWIGPLGYIDRSCTPDGLVRAILALPTASERADVAWRRPPKMEAEAFYTGITRRELEVLRFFADGLTNKQIARHLSVTEATIKFHSRNILQKLSAATRSQAVFIAVRTGMIGGA